MVRKISPKFRKTQEKRPKFREFFFFEKGPKFRKKKIAKYRPTPKLDAKTKRRKLSEHRVARDVKEDKHLRRRGEQDVKDNVRKGIARTPGGGRMMRVPIKLDLGGNSRGSKF